MTAILEKPKRIAAKTKEPSPMKWTRAQYYELDRLGLFDDKRTELIRGEIVFMPPINFPHTVAVENTELKLKAVFGSNFWVRSQVPLNCGTSDPQPDVQVLPGPRSDYTDHGTLAVLIVEIADSTLSYDTKEKSLIYAEAGNPEYWVLDLKRSRLIVYRKPTKNGYKLQTIHKRTDSVAPLALPQVPIKVSDLLP